MYRTFFRPGWLLAHISVLAVVSVFVGLGFWQLGRHEERRELVALVESRRRLPTTPLQELLTSPTVASRDARQHAYRRVRATGTFDPDKEVLLEGRTDLGRPGSHVLTPLLTEQGSAVIVNRGWVPLDLDPPVLQTPPPEGEVTVTGVLVPPEPRPRFGPAEPPPGNVKRLPRADLGRLQDQLPYRIYPLVLQQEKQEPPNRGPLPKLAPLATPGEGPHLPYALQWFSFAGIATITYLAFLRRRALG